jgi:chromosomal replication initiator protein
MQRTIMDDSHSATETQISAISESLAERIGQQKFRIWFKNSTKLTLAGDYLKVGVPNLFIASWIENHFSSEISDAVRSVTGIEAKITFTIDPELTGHQRRTQLDSQASSVATAQAGRQRPRFVTERKHRSAAVNGPQRNRLKLSLDTFVVGSSNELAYNAARLIVKEQESPFNPLFVHG